MSKTSNYRGVRKRRTSSSKAKPWTAQLRIGEYDFCQMFDTEREAAIQYDKWRIRLGMDPVNILRPKIAV